MHDKRICIIINKANPVYSETFIKNHIDFLGSIYIDFNEYKSHFDFKKFQLSAAYYFYLRRKRKAIRDLLFLIKRNNIKILLAEYGHIGADALEIAKYFNLPLIIHFHGHEAYRTTILEKYADKYQKAFDYASAIIVVSRHMENQLLDLGAPREKLFYNCYGVDLTKFSKNKEILPNKLLISVGRFVDKKAPYFVLLAFKKVLDVHSDAKLMMIGDGYLLDSTKNLASYLVIADAVEFMGSIDHAETIEQMNKSSVFVQHSITAGDNDREGTPNTILEAGACGLPVVSTRHAGIPDVIVEGETGFLVDEGDVDQMAEHLVYLLNHPSIAQEMGKKARKVIEEKFTLEQSIGNLKRIIDSCV